MEFDMNTFLGGFDKQFSDTLKNADLDSSAGSAEVPPGKYAVQIVGMAWKELRAKVPDGFSGMGISMRLRILSGASGEDSQFGGWYETPVYWILRKWPARDIPETQLNTATLELFARMMRRCGYDCPAESLAELKDWKNPVGDSIEIQIKKETKGDREYRNIYLNRASVVRPRFPRETWSPNSESWNIPAAELEDIPF